MLGSFSMWTQPLYLRSKFKNTQNTTVGWQFSKILKIDEFRVLNIVCPSYQSPKFSSPFIKSFNKSYSTNVCIFHSSTTFIKNSIAHTFPIIVMKYFPNFNGICSVGLSKVSNNTFEIVSIKKFAFLVRLSQCSSKEEVIISFKITKASTYADNSPYFSCLILFPILSRFVSDSWSGLLSIWGLSSGYSMSMTGGDFKTDVC